MADHADPLPLCYCTNVHPGRTLAELRAQLDEHAVGVRNRLEGLGWTGPLGLGLWVSDDASRTLVDLNEIDAFRDWLEERGLRVVTINGFPFGDFHGQTVKHRVYEPDWTSPERLEYTVRLAYILAGLCEPGARRSISTLPIGWKGADEELERHRMDTAALRLVDLAAHLRRVEYETGRWIGVDLEPEPGCVLQRSGDVAQFFERHLRPRGPAMVDRYLGVCHDVCHASVMFEPQAVAVANYAKSGVRIGKVQVSSAVDVRIDASGRGLEALRDLAEPRYLHQTYVKTTDGFVAHDDLPEALMARTAGRWRVHFHVPVHMDAVGELGTTKDAFVALLAELQEPPDCFEVETYAWDVLPEAHRPRALADGIAEELEWTRARLADSGHHP